MVGIKERLPNPLLTQVIQPRRSVRNNCRE
uniref:Uncharacterized protein n=1 Tax=Siphoviridae sp. cttdo1 TaxID=2823606 RepID=A0A8S5LBZ5_9CAUD|nr:MAG TPA: hypothetical protein [Siphoviridae sp. cttdo1]